MTKPFWPNVESNDFAELWMIRPCVIGVLQRQVGFDDEVADINSPALVLRQRAIFFRSLHFVGHVGDNIVSDADMHVRMRVVRHVMASRAVARATGGTQGRKRLGEVVARLGWRCSAVIRAGFRAWSRAWLLMSMLCMHARGLEGRSAPREAALSCLELCERRFDRVEAVVDERDDAVVERLELACDCGEVARLIAAGGRADGRVDLA